MIREYERMMTTVLNSFTGLRVAEYTAGIEKRLGERGLHVPVSFMQSFGGTLTADEARARPIALVDSGPVGGVVGANDLGKRLGIENIITADMGGTSLDVSVISDNRYTVTQRVKLREFLTGLSKVDVVTVGAGGGSIAWLDTRGIPQVGPRSAGADPGPASYGRGGEEPTVTDANLLLGRLDADAPLAGGVALDRDAAERAVGALADALKLDPVACAEGIVRVANAEMVRALRVMTVEQGIDPRRFALLAFGGAGPLHAAAIADELGMATILCPRASGVLSALGLAAADRRATEQRTVLLAGDELTDDALAGARDELADAARATLGAQDVRVELAHDIRYRGQAHELTVRDLAQPELGALREAFEALHEERYGYRDDGTPVELVTIRATASVAGPELDLAAGDSAAQWERSRREVVFDGERHDAEILRGEPAPGERVAGPAVCELPEATLVVPPGWSGTVDEAGTLVLEREAR
jgi:N-methylhydantoinase A